MAKQLRIVDSIQITPVLEWKITKILKLLHLAHNQTFEVIVTGRDDRVPFSLTGPSEKARDENYPFTIR